MTQVPQVTATPHPADTVPQFLPAQAAALVSGVHPQMFAVPAPPHVNGIVQFPQLILPPHPLETKPQFFPPVHAVACVSGVHPHTFGVPALPHVNGAVQVPHRTLRRWPQLSRAVTVPQFLPSRAQNAALVSGAHAARSSPVSSPGSTTGTPPSESGSFAPDPSEESGGALPHAALNAAPRDSTAMRLRQTMASFPFVVMM
jgi:hypothetical protein